MAESTTGQYVRRYVNSVLLASFIWHFFVLAFVPIVALAQTDKEAYTKESNNPTFDPEHAALFEVGELRVVVGDQYPHGGSERSNYTGIHHLSHQDRTSNVFCPYYAGLIGQRRTVAFEKIDDHSARIFSGTGPSLVRETYRAIAPYYLDYTGSFTAGGTTTGWNATSYMNAPSDLGFWIVQSDGQWVYHASPRHGTRASVAPHDFGPLPKIKQTENSEYPHGGGGFHEGFSDLRFDSRYPLFYGRFDDFVMIFMIEPKYGSQYVPYMSPTGGGYSHEFERNNPAWDYRFYLKNLEPGKQVDIRSRLVYKKFQGRNDVLAEYRKWADNLEASQP